MSGSRFIYALAIPPRRLDFGPSAFKTRPFELHCAALELQNGKKVRIVLHNFFKAHFLAERLFPASCKRSQIISAAQSGHVQLCNNYSHCVIRYRPEERLLPAEAEAFVRELATFQVKNVGSDK